MTKKLNYRMTDETDNVYGLLLVLEYAGTDKHDKAQWLCQCECGNTVVVIGSHLRTSNTQSCGCLQKERTSENRKAVYGKDHHRWKGGPGNRHDGRPYKRWRDAVKKRDNYHCQMTDCNYQGSESDSNLHAHHILDWASYPELRLDIDNGITYCKECHIELHRRIDER